jgi:monovalent cation/hydrogen antiporter
LKNATGLHCQLYIFTIYDIPCNIIFDHTGGRSFIDNGFSETKDRLSHYARKRNKFLSFSSRLHGTSVWSVLVFTLNGLIFILIGLELPVIVHNLGNVSLTSAILYGLLVTFVLMGARVACALGASAFTSFISRFIKTADSRPGWKSPLVFGWAGMRGVVSLAAALSIPAYTLDGTTFPQRNLILFITFIVIITTLVIHGLTLPALIKRLKLEDPDHYPASEQQEKMILEKLSAVSKDFMQKHYQQDLQQDQTFPYYFQNLHRRTKDQT